MDKIHKLAVILTGVALIVLLFLLPRTEGSKDSDTQPERTELVRNEGMEAELDSVLQLINGDAPMQGIMALRELSERYPDEPLPQFYLGLFSIQTGQYDKAVERFRRVIELDPANWEAWRMLGNVSLELGDKETALEALEQYLRLNPEAEDRAEVERILEDLKN